MHRIQKVSFGPRLKHSIDLTQAQVWMCWLLLYVDSCVWIFCHHQVWQWLTVHCTYYLTCGLHTVQCDKQIPVFCWQVVDKCLWTGRDWVKLHVGSTIDHTTTTTAIKQGVDFTTPHNSLHYWCQSLKLAARRWLNQAWIINCILCITTYHQHLTEHVIQSTVTML